MKYHKYHDSILKEINVLWENGTVTLKVLTNDGLKIIIIENMRNMDIQRKFSWGKSSSINEIEIGDSFIKLEMQSGDNLIFDGDILEI